MMNSRGFLAFVIVGLVLAGPAMGQVVVSNEYENLDDRALNNVPVTVSRLGAAGDFTKGVTPSIGGRKLPAQVDVLRKNDDGSIRHALVSFVLPSLPAGGKLKIDWLNEKPAAPAEFQWAIERSNFPMVLTFAPEAGGVLTSDVGKIVSGKWAAGDRVKVLYDGPMMKEFEIHDVPVDAAGKPDPHLEVFWRLRVFTASKSVRVAAIVERCKARKTGGKNEPMQYKFKSVRLAAGDEVLYEEGPYDHLDQTRYRILVWTDGQLENIHRRPNYDYWVKGKFLPKYRFTKDMTVAMVDKTYAVRTNDRNNQVRKQGILEHGIIHRHMPGTGGRWEMEPYPAWTVGYVLGGAPKTYECLLHADGNGAGAFFVHVRQDGAPGYDIRTVKQPPQDSGYRHDLYGLPDGGRTPVQPDHAHAPSLGYVSYLLTGDKFYAEEASFWAAFQMGEWPHKGLRWQGMDRAFAYGMRHVVDAAFILPDGHPLKDYFTWGVNDCMDQMTRVMLGSNWRVHSPPGPNFRSSGRPDWVNAKHCSVWQYCWVVWSLGNAADKGFPKAAPVRDWAADYVVGFYTSDDEFKGPDGKVYRYDPRDAIAYSTAAEVVETKVVTNPNGAKVVELVKPNGRHLDNYGEIWYYTKLNVDNSYHLPKGLTTEPDADGNWPLREKGWGGGMTWDTLNAKQVPWWNWHRYGGWVAIVTAVEAGAPNGRKAWDVMVPLAGKQGLYDYEMVPRRGL